MTDIRFESLENKEEVSSLRDEWLDSLNFPNDSFDESNIDGSQHWALKLEEGLIGYASVFKKNTLLQFYIIPKYLNRGRTVLEAFIAQNKIEKAFVGTNNPMFLSLIMHFQKSVEIDAYIFKDMEEVQEDEREVAFRVAESNELEQILEFNTNSYPDMKPTEESQAWTKKYYADCINNGVIHLLKKESEIIGVLEARTTSKSPKKTTFGFVILPKYRGQGFGSYLLGKGKALAKARDSVAICGCRANNIGSRKAIEKSGFRILHMVLLLKL